MFESHTVRAEKLLIASLKEQSPMRTIAFIEKELQQKEQQVNERLSSLKESLAHQESDPLEVLVTNFTEQLKKARLELDDLETQLCSIEKRRPSDQQEEMEKDSFKEMEKNMEEKQLMEINQLWVQLNKTRELHKKLMREELEHLDMQEAQDLSVS